VYLLQLLESLAEPKQQVQVAHQAKRQSPRRVGWVSIWPTATMAAQKAPPQLESWQLEGLTEAYRRLADKKSDRKFAKAQKFPA